MRAIWSSAKLWRSIDIGPIAIFYKLGRSTATSSNKRRLIKESKSAGKSTSCVPVSIANEAGHRLRAATLTQTAIVVGVAPGLGESIARRFVEEGLNVAIAARDVQRLFPIAVELQSRSRSIVEAYSCDATSDGSVNELIALVQKDMGIPDVVVYSVQGFWRAPALEIPTDLFEDHWRQNCLGAFVFAREAARAMLTRGSGTIVLIGSTSGIVAREDHLTLAVGKHGLRALAQILARELWPQGIHVAHLIIDADIKENDFFGVDVPQADPAHLADLIWSIHKQPKSAWTSEMDARPATERFWEHC